MAEVWTVLKVLQWTADYLSLKGVENGRRDAELLLGDTLGLDRVGLYLNFDRPLEAGELIDFRSRVARRARREPVQYILGRTEFWSLPLRVTPDVLIPRPDTELLVEEALKRLPAKWRADSAGRVLDDIGRFIPPTYEELHPPSEKLQPLSGAAARVLDVGTGSGALAIALAHERPEAAVTAIDISPAALAVASANARDNGVAERIAFIVGDLGELPAGPFDLIVANPPYIPSRDLAALMPEVRDFEPRLALDGGADGLDAYRAMARQSGSILVEGGWMLVEVGIDQAADIRELFVRAGLAEVFTARDLAGIERVVGGRLA